MKSCQTVVQQDARTSTASAMHEQCDTVIDLPGDLYSQFTGGQESFYDLCPPLNTWHLDQLSLPVCEPLCIRGAIEGITIELIQEGSIGKRCIACGELAAGNERIDDLAGAGSTNADANVILPASSGLRPSAK